MIEIRKITSKETFVVRHPMLRKGKPIESCHFEGDDLATTWHFGLFENEKIKGVISVFENDNILFNDKKQKQIRGMAVIENNQGKGFGKLLVTYTEAYLIKNNVNLIWFNAREKAVRFYEKMGYKIKGKPFDIPEIGIHYVMYKKL